MVPHSSNANKNPGKVDISSSDKDATPAPKNYEDSKTTKPRVTKVAKSAKEFGANIQCLATYEKASLENDRL